MVMGVAEGQPQLRERISLAIIKCRLSVELRPLVLQEPTPPARSLTSAFDPKRTNASER